MNPAQAPAPGLPAGLPAMPASVGDTTAVPIMATAEGLYSWGANGWQGAELSGARGYVYFPQLDTRRELDSYTRTELLRRARALYRNVGLVRRIINGMARMVVGTGIIPQPTTPDEEWNTLASEAFAARYESAPVWDVGGRFNGYKQQLVMQKRRYLDGDVAKVYVSSAAGRARTALYEAHQIKTMGELNGAEARWFDGVYVDRNHRALKYRIAGEGDSFVDIRSDDMVLLADFDSSGQARGATVLAHAINNILDVTEIRGFWKHGLKTTAMVGWYLAARDAAQVKGVGQVLGPHNTREVTNADGQKITVKDIVAGAGQLVDVGFRDIKTVHDERPHPNSEALLQEIVRDIAWGSGLSPDVLWNIAALGGANSRFVLADAQGFIDSEQDDLFTLSIKRDWHITIAKDINTGNLREPNTGPGTWLGKVSYIPPKRVTVDYGRDGKLMLEQLARGALGHERWFGMQGQDAREETEKELAFRAWRRDTAVKKYGFAADPLLVEGVAEKVVVESDDKGKGGKNGKKDDDDETDD